MRILSRSTLVEYWRRRPEAEPSLKAWFAEAERAAWQKPPDVKKSYGSASLLRGGRVVFNIAGNQHRMVVWINYGFQTIYIKWLGTHKEYDKIDAESV